MIGGTEDIPQGAFNPEATAGAYDHDPVAVAATLIMANGTERARLHIPARLPTDDKKRKNMPIASGVLDYFPDALAAVAELSKVGNDKHNPGEPLHWSRSKSKDHADTIIRHFLERGSFDTDKVRHSVKLAWRALALLQEEIEAAHDLPISRGSRP